MFKKKCLSSCKFHLNVWIKGGTPPKDKMVQLKEWPGFMPGCFILLGRGPLFIMLLATPGKHSNSFFVHMAIVLQLYTTVTCFWNSQKIFKRNPIRALRS